MKPWSNVLLEEYKKGRKQLRNMLKTLDDDVPEDKEDIRVINSAIRDMNFVIDWLDTGIMPEPGLKRYRAYTYKDKFVYGLNGYWDDSVGAFISTSTYIDPYKEIEEKIDKELEEKRRAKHC